MSRLKCVSCFSPVCRVVELTGDVTPDMRAIAQADLIVTTPEKWDGVSRSWQNRSYVQKVAILIIDEIHLLGKKSTADPEWVMSRQRPFFLKIKTHGHEFVPIQFCLTKVALSLNQKDPQMEKTPQKERFFNMTYDCGRKPEDRHADNM